MKPNHFFVRARRFAGIAGIAGMFFAQSSGLAGGPIWLCDTGSPFLWPGGGANIPFNPDLGSLGPLDNTDAAALVQSAFSIWEAVPSATVSYVNAGALPIDVDITNFVPFIFPESPDGLSAIIFDDTGEIFDLLFGPGSGILGFAGPEWVDFSNCSVLEGVAVLNGPAFGDAVAAMDVMVHEFGHYTGLGHTVVNGQVGIGDTSGPTPANTFGFPEITDIETMYPFYFGPGVDWASLKKDDISSVSALYPAAGFDSGTATISGTIRRSNGQPVSGVNVIARNLAAPFADAVSAISGDYSLGFPGDPRVGTYALRGLTPGASYVVFIDQILAGGFSTAPVFPFPGQEEFYNGPAESDNITSTDVVTDYTAVSAGAGSRAANIDIIFNRPKPGEPLPVGDDGSFELPLPFVFELCGQRFTTISVNANGNVTLGRPDGSLFASIPAFLSGPPRVAALWRDLNPAAGGIVTYAQTPNTFKVIYSKVPEFPATGENSFEIELRREANAIDVRYGAMSAKDGLAGVSGGPLITSSFETPVDLSTLLSTRINLHGQPAIFELFGAAHPNDLSGKTVMYTGTTAYSDKWAEPNNTLALGTPVALPFDSKSVKKFTEIKPSGGDVDYYRFQLNAGEIFVGRVLNGAMDSLLGLFRLSGSKKNPVGTLVAMDDDGGPGLLSTIVYRVPTSGEYAVAVTCFPDMGFTGAGAGQGRYVLDLQTVTASPNNPIVNGSFEFDFVGWTTVETGPPFIPWSIAGAGSGAGFEMAPTQPQDGTRVAWNGFDGEGPMTFTMHQDVAIRAGASSAVLEWKDRVQWNFLVGTQTLPRRYEVQVRNPATDAVLQTLFTFSTGIAPGLGDSGWTSHSANLSAYIGSTVRIYFVETIPEPFTGPGQIEFDAVRLPVN